MLRGLCVLLVAGGCALQAGGTAAPSTTVLHARVGMRDGVQLDTDIIRPAARSRYPAILVRTPYGKGGSLPQSYAPFVARGYALVLQDVRGRYRSGGVFDPLEQEGPDGYDTLNWIARQSWSDGAVGMIGGSYLGIAQWKAALLNNPHLKAIFPAVAGDDDYLDRFYSTGGAMKLAHRLLWLSENLNDAAHSKSNFPLFVRRLPLRTSDQAATGHSVPFYQRSLDHPLYDSFWRRLSTREHMDKVRIPVFSLGGWFDNYVESDLDAFTRLERSASHSEHHLLIGPWPHSMSARFPGVDFGPSSSAPVRSIQLAWFDRWLKGKPDAFTALLPASAQAQSRSSLHLFVMGANRWREEFEWPLARTRWTSLYFNSTSSALSWRLHEGRGSNRFTYDPANPVPTAGGAVCCNPKLFPWGPMDQRAVEARPDVLVYTSKPLKHDVEVTGPVKVVLNVSTSAPDTDFTSKLVDVFPNGEARNLCDGVLRLRYRNGVSQSVLAKPGEIYPIEIDGGVTSNVFLAGHSIRIEISSSNFPRFDRNPNTGGPIAGETHFRIAEQTVHTGRAYPSHVLLPVIPGLTSASSPRYGSKRTLIARGAVAKW